MAEAVGLTLLENARRTAMVRDTSRPVLLVGFQHQGNLGLGYLASTLRQHGYAVTICDIEAPVADIVTTAQRLQPMIVRVLTDLSVLHPAVWADYQQPAGGGDYLPLHDGRALSQPEP